MQKQIQKRAKHAPQKENVQQKCFKKIGRIFFNENSKDNFSKKYNKL